MNSQIKSESGLQGNDNYRRLRTYRIPHFALASLVNHPWIPVDPESSRLRHSCMRVPDRLPLPPDAEIHSVWDNPPAMSFDLLVRSSTFDEIPPGEIAPPSLVDEIPLRTVVAVEPDDFADLQRKANSWDEIEGELDQLRRRANLWDQFAVRIAPRKHSPVFRWVFRWDSILWLYRLCRLTYEVGERGQKGWHAVQWTLGLVPTFFKFRREDDSWILRILGLRIHRKVSYGGRPD